ncbi:uncharacterized protein BP01DRAFT_356327 [Aspergillus saccharolyticus JOP 1030-1]|uniref:Uncharacterized protein n=1 Tax=Aspergillus saccharolyticus JOP 1030-1 TaxID=1450539 RepID=A0A318ZF25_9EURO|nr:hypothetical protein BP01DRAFT_356327 [Aspergillus saccharolyticus JOP 1030-1]PYH45695.1 hypothetical protein BP01DRAFT_356327 [Aspergillus saccharolyticus JOP 1030-1]
MPSAYPDTPSFNPLESHSPTTPSTKASNFLATEIYNIGAQPGIRSLPPSPERDFLVLTWGPVVYRTTYSPLSDQLLPLFLRVLSTEVQAAIPRCLPGTRKQLLLLETNYACKVFSDEKQYGHADIGAVRRAFHNWKRAELALPVMELPTRLRVCLVVDEGVVEELAGMVRRREHMVDGETEEGEMIMDDGEKETDGEFESESESGSSYYARCPVIMVEENFPDRRRRDSNPADGVYPGWTKVALSTVVEVLDGLRFGNGLSRYHRPGKVYLGEDRWS